MIKGEIRHNQILDVIYKNPGLNFCDMMRITGLKNGVVSYHVGNLEKKNMVTVIRKSGNTRFFPIHVTEQESVLLEMLRRPTPREIILLLEKSTEGITLNTVMTETCKAQSTISSYLQLLVSKNIVTIRLCDRRKIFVLKNIAIVRSTLQKYNITPVSKIVQNFNDMFEFL